ncbi:unnamed protein product [Trifolium pratense]|uniref:Uncharacterized protein n=1 Tax=Trifolium pratense TaxID=57577 RepID=A0ACB0JUN9_TRIPR|nr:unnamed protein product [Trifolium pratense]
MMLGLWPSKLRDTCNLLLSLQRTSEIFEHVILNPFFFSKTEKLLTLLILRSNSLTYYVCYVVVVGNTMVKWFEVISFPD